MLNKGFFLIIFCISLNFHLVWTKVSPGNAGRVRAQDSMNPQWTWKCAENTLDGPSCIRTDYDPVVDLEPKVPSAICFLTCGPHRALWPYPSGQTTIGSTLTSFLPSNIQLSSVEAPNANIQNMLQSAMEITLIHINRTYLQGLEEMDPPKKNYNSKVPYNSESNIVQVTLNVVNEDSTIKIGTDESYSITARMTQAGENEIVSVIISGNTYFGVRHGLETLTQLLAFNEFSGYLQITNQVEILNDSPKFSYRGLSIDTGRNFIPIPNLKKMVDGMAQNKLNMFHWHLSDSNSFPFESKRVPQVTKFGTFSSKKLYTPEQVTEFIQYANLRGVKIIPELDAPSHAGNGWNWGHLEGLGDLSLCVNLEPYQNYCIQPPCGQLNPLNNHTYNVLGMLYQDLLDVFDRDLFHMGNDEISFKCWLNYTEILEWLEGHGTEDLMELWGVFQNTALQKLKDANEGQPISAIVWTSDMTAEGRRFLKPEDYVIHIWHEANESSIKDILQEDYRVIFSNKDNVYLDHGFGPWRGYPPTDRATMKFWQHLYSYDIMNIVQGHVGKDKADELYAKGNIFGGEACLWSEKTDEHNMEMKLWPRGAAFAEKMWSNPTPGSTRYAYPRMILHRLRMISRGARPDTLLPESCHYLMGFCD